MAEILQTTVKNTLFCQNNRILSEISLEFVPKIKSKLSTGLNNGLAANRW